MQAINAWFFLVSKSLKLLKHIYFVLTLLTCLLTLFNYLYLREIIVVTVLFDVRRMKSSKGLETNASKSITLSKH